MLDMIKQIKLVFTTHKTCVLLDMVKGFAFLSIYI